MKLFKVLLSLALSFAAATASSATFVPLDAKATYLRTANDFSALPATPLKLSDFAFNAGDVLVLQAVGDVNYWRGGASGFLSIGVFSSTSTLLDSSAPNRVPGAIATDGYAFVTERTFIGQLTTDIAADFAYTNTPIALVTVPAGAQYLFVAIHDGFYGDNTDLNQDFGLLIGLAPVPEASTWLLLLCGLVLIGLHLQRQRKKNSWRMRIGISNALFPSSWHPEHGRTGAEHSARRA